MTVISRRYYKYIYFVSRRRRDRIIYKFRLNLLILNAFYSFLSITLSDVNNKIKNIIYSAASRERVGRKIF
jgi:hypothetical protein